MIKSASILTSGGPIPESSVKSVVTGWLALIRARSAAKALHNDLAMLSDLDPHMLADIGLQNFNRLSLQEQKELLQSRLRQQ